MKKHIVNFGYALLIVVLGITAIGFAAAGIELIVKLGTDYVPFIKLAREANMYWQAVVMIGTSLLAVAFIVVTWFAWKDNESLTY